jgi:hypothetical protein
MADDARTKIRERMANVEKRMLAWVCSKRQDLRDKPLTAVIAILRQEDRQAREVIHRFKSDSQLDTAITTLKALQMMVDSTQSPEPERSQKGQQFFD